MKTKQKAKVRARRNARSFTIFYPDRTVKYGKLRKDGTRKVTVITP